MSDDDRNAISRRTMLAAGAAGVGATALGALPGATSAFAATSSGADAMDEAGAALGLSPSALPPLVPGATTGAGSKYHMIPLGFSGNPGESSTSVGSYPINGSNLELPLPLQAGDRLVRLDVYFYLPGTGTGNASLIATQVDTTNTAQSTQITTPTGTGVLVGTTTAPYTVGVGQSLHVGVGSIYADVNHQFVGAIWQYFPAKPAMTLLPTPVRVYDSRPAFAPATGPKTPLNGGSARTIDLKTNGSGVPAGAAAVLVNVGATGTTGAGGGFLAIYRNGIGWPGTSNVNWSGPGQNVSSTTLTAVDANGLVNLYANVATDVLIDVLAYYS